VKVSGVRLAGHSASKGKHRKPKPGKLLVSVGCDQSAKITLRGMLTELLGKKPKHGKQRRKRFKLGPVSGAVTGTEVGTLTMKLPPEAAQGLERKRKEQVAFTLVAQKAG
jgi:hypothetical protein